MFGKTGIAFLLILSCACLAIRNGKRSPDNFVLREDEYSRIMLFIADPFKNFKKIKEIENPFQYFNTAEYNSKEEIFETFLERFFNEVDDKRAKILVYLIMQRATGETAYLLVDHIINLFISSPKPFLDALQERKDWPYFAELMKVGNWADFVSAVRGLTDTGFEGAFKHYVLR